MRLTKRILEAIIDMANMVEAEGVQAMQGRDDKEAEKDFQAAMDAAQWAAQELAKREAKKRGKMTKPIFRINIWGNWQSGYWWQIIRTDSGSTMHENGPYPGHPLDAKVAAWDDAVVFAEKQGVKLESTENPYRYGKTGV